MPIRSVTLTGVEESTDLDELVRITRRAEGIQVEWGVLYSPERAGRGGRYPSREWIGEFARFASERHLCAALHVCGRGVDELIQRKQETSALANRFARVQLNINQKRWPFSVWELEELISTLGRPVITQHNEHNESLALLIRAPNHQILIDASGGTGRSPAHWLSPPTPKATGYAGGLGPDNLGTEIERIAAALGPAGPPAWVDMESKLFTPDGRFDSRRAEEVIRIVQTHASVHESAMHVRFDCGPGSAVF